MRRIAQRLRHRAIALRKIADELDKEAAILIDQDGGVTTQEGEADSPPEGGGGNNDGGG